jgi:dihydroorotate dehydrogenase (NAD+) catalytic subunit
MRDRISVRIGKIEFKNPVFSASGIWGYGDEISSLVELDRLGGMVTKTLTLEPRTGNVLPRIQELPTGLLNSIGLENVGIAAFIEDKLPVVAKLGTAVVVSIAGDDEDAFAELSARLAAAEGYVGVEINLSCPNVQKGGIDHGRNPVAVERITAIVKRALPDKAVMVKLTPNVTSIADVASAAEAGGADAVTAINTLLGADFDLATGKPVFARVSAGYSGPGILPVALEKVWETSRAVSIPVIGVGGIGSIDDARKFFLAGASAVQIGTALFTRPRLAEEIVAALEANPQWVTGGA